MVVKNWKKYKENLKNHCTLKLIFVMSKKLHKKEVLVDNYWTYMLFFKYCIFELRTFN